MSDLNTPGVALAGGTPGRATSPDDDFSRRMGIALAASLGINFLLFAGAGLLADSMERVKEAAPVQITMRPAVVVPATPIPAPAVVPTPVAATSVPATPVARRPTPAPATPRATPLAATPVPVRPTPRPVVATPAPAPALTQKNVARTGAAVTAATVAAAAVTRTANAVQRPATNQTVDIKNSSLTAQPTNVTQTTITPAMKRELETLRPTSAQPLLGTQRGTTFVAKSSSSSGGASSASISANAARSNAVTGRSASGATASVSATLNPVVVQPEARSTLSGDTRQITTVRGVASSAKGRTSVVTMTAKSSEVSPSSFVVPTGGSIKAGVATARQGGAGTNAIAAVSGAPTAISTSSEYAVYAPQVETRGVIGIRGTARAPVSRLVKELQQKGDIGQVVAGTAVLAAAPSGRASSTAQARAGASAANVAGVELSARPGNGVGGGAVRGESRDAEAVSVRGAGTGTASKSVPVGGGVGNGPRGSEAGQVAGVANGVAGGTPSRGGAVGARATQAGSVNAAVGSGAKAVDNISEKTTAVSSKAVERKVVNLDPDLGQSELDLPGKVNTQVAAKPLSKGLFDLPDNLRSMPFKGSVTVRVTVDANGSHSEEITDGSGSSSMDQAALAYMKRWRWEAAKQDGKAVKSVTTVKLPIEVK